MPCAFLDFQNESQILLKGAKGYHGWLWLHEHPFHADSWRKPWVGEALARPEVHRACDDMCAWNMKSVEASGKEKLVLKPTSWATNSQRLATVLSKRCENLQLPLGLRHEHANLQGSSRTSKCAIYPPGLVSGILEGLLQEMRSRGLWEHGGVSLTSFGLVNAEEPDEDWEQWSQEVDLVDGVLPAPPHRATNRNDGLTQGTDPRRAMSQHGSVTDDSTSGKLLPQDLVEEEEIRQAHLFNFYTKLPISECLAETGKPLLDIVWAVANKGDDENPDIRGRVCVKELKAKGPCMEGVFALTPPFEGLRLLFSLGMSRTCSWFWTPHEHIGLHQ